MTQTREIDIPGAICACVLDDNRVLSVQPLTFGRFRLCIAEPHPFHGGPDLVGYNDGY
jgi:hypothetical protein